MSRPTTDHRRALVTDHLHLVHHVVNQLSARYPRHIDRRELWNAGALGLVDAARRFDPAMGTPFAPYAMIRIRGAIIDSTRARDWASRSVRRGMRELRQAAEAFRNEHAREPSLDELAEQVGLTRAELDERRADATVAKLLHLDQPLGSETDDATLADLIEERSRDLLPEESLQQRELVGTLRTAITTLPDVQREVVERYYFDGEYLHEIAASLGVTEARVSQIRSEALNSVRAYFSEAYEGVPGVDDSAPGQRRRGAFVVAMTTGSDWRSRLAAADRPLVKQSA